MKVEFKSGSSALTVGKRIKIARKLRGLTSVELARRLGRPQSFVAAYETDARKPKDELIKKFAEALNVNYLYLKNGESLFVVEDNDDITIQNYYIASDYIVSNNKNSEDYQDKINEVINQLGNNSSGSYNYSKMIYEFANTLLAAKESGIIKTNIEGIYFDNNASLPINELKHTNNNKDK